MKIVQVNDPALARAFLKVHLKINQDNPDFVQPLNQDVDAVFDPEKNKLFRQGQARRWPAELPVRRP